MSPDKETRVSTTNNLDIIMPGLRELPVELRQIVYTTAVRNGDNFLQLRNGVLYHRETELSVALPEDAPNASIAAVAEEMRKVFRMRAMQHFDLEAEVRAKDTPELDEAVELRRRERLTPMLQEVLDASEEVIEDVGKTVIEKLSLKIDLSIPVTGATFPGVAQVYQEYSFSCHLPDLRALFAPLANLPDVKEIMTEVFCHPGGDGYDEDDIEICDRLRKPFRRVLERELINAFHAMPALLQYCYRIDGYRGGWAKTDVPRQWVGFKSRERKAFEGDDDDKKLLGLRGCIFHQLHRPDIVQWNAFVESFHLDIEVSSTAVVGGRDPKEVEAEQAALWAQDEEEDEEDEGEEDEE